MADISQIKLPDGTTYDITDLKSGYTKNTGTVTSVTVSGGTGISVSGSPITTSGTITVTNSGATGVKGNSESTYRTGQVNLTAANIGAVATSGNETVAGDKTFSGTTKITADSVYSVGANTKIPANSAAIIQSPIPKYLWHDLFAFNSKTVPTFYTTTDNSAWTVANLDSRSFIQKENFSLTVIKATGQTGARWQWHNTGFSYSSGLWLVIGVAYSASVATTTITFESSADGETWTTRYTGTHAASASPIWCYINGGYGSHAYLRLTMTKDVSDTTKTFAINAIKLLSARWGDQGGGSEYEYPYQWDTIPNIFPLKNNTSTLGTDSYKWADIYSTKVNGYSLAAACAKGVDTSISASSSSTNLPTSAAVASFVENKGYLTLSTLPIYDGTVV